MNLANLPKIVSHKSKRVGRGIGSGKGGHTTGRGNKGQKARGNMSPLFEGTKAKKSFIKRLPLLRGKGRMKPISAKPTIINLSDLSSWNKEQKVNLANLVKNGLVNERTNSVKVLGSGEIGKALQFEKVLVSASALKKIESAGGSVNKK